MNRLKLAIGSRNPVKILAALQGFQLGFPGTGVLWPKDLRLIPAWRRSTDVVCRGHYRVPGGACRGLLAACPEADYHVGIEGGIEELDERLFASAWIVIQNQQGVQGMAKSGLFPLPAPGSPGW